VSERRAQEVITQMKEQLQHANSERDWALKELAAVARLRGTAERSS
jgi:hypothetical protein